MYWNQYTASGNTRRSKINSNMRCIEIEMTDEQIDEELMINSNMRCIEMYNDNAIHNMQDDKQ